MAKKKRTKQYILFVLGYWDNITDIIREVVEVVSPFTMDFSDMRYIHSDTSLICMFKSNEDFTTITNYIMEELDPIIDVCILIPKPLKFSSRMEESIENHLLGKNKIDLDNLIVDDLQDWKDLEDIIGKNTKNTKQTPPKLRINSNTNTEANIILDLDTILDKISEKGIDSLATSEIKFLKNQSKT